MLRPAEQSTLQVNRPPCANGTRRRQKSVNHAASACFVISGAAFLACGLGLVVNRYLTGILAVAGTAAIGLVYLAAGVFSLAGERADTGEAEFVDRTDGDSVT